METVILTMGLNHTTAPIQLREQITAAPCIRDEALEHLHTQLNAAPVSEHLLLSTCNRTEIYALLSDRARGESLLRDLFTAQDAFAPARGALYTYADRDAVAHLFAVASGIDSMVVGEFEILGQVRRAYLAAAERHMLGPVLHHLFNEAIHAGKRAHAETAIGARAASVASAAVALARRRLGDLRGRRALVIGAGEMAQRAAKNLAADGACAVMVANRTFDHARSLAREIGGRAIQFDQLSDALGEADLVISATAAPHFILSAPMVNAALSARNGQPLCLIDIAVPRDVDPQVAQIPNAQLFNIDDLTQLVDANRAEREQAVTQVHAIIAEEVEKFWEWYAERRAVPVITELRGHAEAIREAELQKAFRRLGHLQLTERDRNVITALSAGIVSKLLAAPTAHLKERVQSGDGQAYLDTLRELFELSETEPQGSPRTQR
ncbi:MAG: glutamyl-tRNA reductase [Chloroflexota bacterium]|nr:glutamyl-tRNA reductase [Chloroflexota bacterium]